MMNGAEVHELLRGQEVILARIDERLERTETDVKELLRVVVHGNGHPSLMSRVAVLEAAGANLWRQRGLYVTLVAAFVGALVEILRSMS